MARLIYPIVLIGLVFIGSATGAAAQGAPGARAPQGVLPGGGIRVKKAQIIDQTGFERPMTAASMLIPVSWQPQGGVVWNPQKVCGQGYSIQFSAASPDGSTGVIILPGENWEANSIGQRGNCPMATHTNIRQYLDSFVQRNRPGARVLDFRMRQDIMDGLRALNSEMPMPGGGSRTYVEAGEVLIGYENRGIEMRETIAAAAMFTVTRMSGMGMGPDYEFLYGASLPGWSMWAPAGQLDLKMSEALRKSLALDPQWNARISQHNRKIAQTNMKGARDRARITAETNREISEMINSGYRERTASQDRMQRETTEMIRGTETYNDPINGGTVELSGMYEHAWQLKDGTYVLTDDPGFNPYQATGMDGQQLEVTR